MHAQAAVNILSLSQRGRIAAMHNLRNSQLPSKRVLAMAIAVDFPEGITGPPATPNVIVLKDKDRRPKHYCVKRLLVGSCKCSGNARSLPRIMPTVPKKLPAPLLCKCVAKALGSNACARTHAYTYAFFE